VLLLAAVFVSLTCWLIARTSARTQETRLRRAVYWSRVWAQGCRWACGWRVEVRGEPPGGALLAPNHSGYCDIFGLGSVLRCFYVAKNDIVRWPLVGFLFTSSYHIAVPRSLAKGLVMAIKGAKERLEAGHNVCIFLEGTSTGNDVVLPFYPPLTQPAIETGCPVVPVAVTWTCSNPKVDVSEDVAYWKDHVLGKHLWRLLGLKGVRCLIEFGDPIEPADMTRAQLAAKAREAVLRMRGLPLNPE
jgi:1-acyl-sn-glycerol-3-phosphate acyltransferase